MRGRIAMTRRTAIITALAGLFGLLLVAGPTIA